MTIYLVSDAGDGTDNGAANTMSPTGTDWGKAEPTLAGALALATTDGDVILIDHAHQESGTSYSSAGTARLRVLVVDKDASNVLSTMAAGGGYLRATSTNNISVLWAAGTYIYGLNIVHTGSGPRTISICGATGASVTYESSRFAIENTGHSGLWSSGGADAVTQTRLINCGFVVSATTNRFVNAGRCIFEGCSMSIYTAGAAPSAWIQFTQTDIGGASHVSHGCDWSALGSSALVGGANTAAANATFSQCKLGSGYVMLDSSSTPGSAAGADVYVHDCASGDTHTAMAYQNKLGTLVCDTGVAFTGSVAGLSWKITTTTLATFGNPFVSPWIALHNTGTSAITPRLEILRDGSATAWETDEVWGEFSAKVTSGSTRATLYSDRVSHVGTPAAQASGSDTWDGENATHWAGKVDSGSSITPAEVGDLCARVCVGVEITGTSGSTLYVDPVIRT